MSEAERIRWEQRYADGDYVPRDDPSPFLIEALETVRPGDALVLACGTGRNAMAVADAGFAVEAVDVSPSAIDRARSAAGARGLTIDFRVADLDEMDLADGRYDFITMIRYVNRPLMERLSAALAPNGWLLVEHHLRTHADVGGPSTDDFRLASGELLERFADLRIIRYEEHIESEDRPGGRACLARMLACKGDPGF